MARLRPGALLSCFYCGRRSTTRFRHGLSSFDCTNCDATNYLDEFGDITDPPVATETVAPRNAPRTTTIVRGPPSPPSSSAAKSIFCDKCLKNQHLYTASLAQYYDSEPGQSESEVPDSAYYKFRNSLEKRYPQVCDACAPGASKVIDRAGYTAKTDHLRKMMERSRQARGPKKTTGPLDWVAAIGWWLWWAGFALEMLWHIKIAMGVLSRPADDASGMSDPDGTSAFMARAAEQVAEMLPSQEWLVQNSLVMAALAFAWNPHLVQVIRGFSRHLLGLQEWYLYQVLILASRFLFGYMPEVEGTQSRQALLSAHLAIGGVMSLLYFRASRSIRVDTTPLFASHESTITAKSKTPTQPTPRRMEPKSFLDELNEVIDSPTFNDPVKREPSPTATSPPYTRSRTRQSSTKDMFGGLSMSESTPIKAEFDDDAMDWTPTQQSAPSPNLPRAFKSSGSSANRGFGQAPIQENTSPFWYHAPAAPLNPAHRLRNPPNQASLRMKPTERGENIFFRNKGDKATGQQDGAARKRGVDFRQPKFFAKDKNSEEDNSLADLLTKSFTIDNDDDDDYSEEEVTSSSSSPKQPRRRRRSQATVRARNPQPVIQAGVLASGLVVWLLTLSNPIPHTADIQLGILVLAGLVSLSLLVWSRAASTIGSAITVAEMIMLGWVLKETRNPFSTGNTVGVQGLTLLGGMLGHLVWDMIQAQRV